MVLKISKKGGFSARVCGSYGGTGRQES